VIHRRHGSLSGPGQHFCLEFLQAVHAMRTRFLGTASCGSIAAVFVVLSRGTRERYQAEVRGLCSKAPQFIFQVKSPQFDPTI
jgi:hypothetical protein